MHMPSPSPIAVIGAGLAGVTCARTLHLAGLPVVVFEQRDTAGGRMTSGRVGCTTVDDGAQFFTARSQAFRALLSEAQIAGAVDTWKPRVVDIDPQTLAPAAIAKIDEAWYVGTPRMNGLVRFMARGLDLRVATSVTQIRRIKAGFTLAGQVQSLCQSLGTFQQVVVATPAAQAHTLLAPSAAASDPALVSALAAVRVDPCYALRLYFEHALPCKFDVVRSGGPVLAWCARDCSKPGREPQTGQYWVAHANADWARAQRERGTTPASADQAAQEASIAHDLREAFGRTVDPTPPQLAELHYFSQAKTRTPAATPFLLSTDRRLGVAGDYMLGARVEAAFESGLALASAMQGTSR